MNDQNTTAQNDIVPEEEVSELDTLKQQVEEFKTRYLRALADYQNLERRMRDEREEVSRGAQALVIRKLLPFLDNLEKAEVFVKDEGLKMIKTQFARTLEEVGVEEVKIDGKEFDPTVAEAVDVVEGKQDNKVVEVLQKGYKLDGKLLRVAQVKVSKKAK